MFSQDYWLSKDPVYASVIRSNQEKSKNRKGKIPLDTLFRFWSKHGYLSQDIGEFDDHLNFSDQSIESLETIDYWLAICPHLNIKNRHNIVKHEGVENDQTEIDKDVIMQAKKKIVTDGFFLLDKDETGNKDEKIFQLALGTLTCCASCAP